VLSGAEDTDVRVAVLAEVYFIDVSVPDVVDWSTRGGQAIGRAILKWLRANQ
jgi:N-acetylmuramoyl-L-alanine amidase